MVLQAPSQTTSPERKRKVPANKGQHLAVGSPEYGVDAPPAGQRGRPAALGDCEGRRRRERRGLDQRLDSSRLST
jgi:hypothetical protein